MGDVHPELSTPKATFDQLKSIFTRRLLGMQKLDRYLFTLNTVRQESGEKARAYADRCQVLGQKTTLKTLDPAQAAWSRNQMDCRVLAAFVRGLRGTAATTLQIYTPKHLEDAVGILGRRCGGWVQMGGSDFGIDN